MSTSPLHQPLVHEAAARHVTGEALYIDDLPMPKGGLVAQLIPSTVAHGRITRLNIEAAQRVPGVVCVLTAKDIPGSNDTGAVIHDEPLFAQDAVQFLGQAVGAVVGESYEACRAGVKAVELVIEPLPALTTLDAAIAANSFLSEPHTLTRGDVDAALANAPFVLKGEVRTGGQDHFYLETHCALAVPQEGGTLHISSSTQHPSEVQAIVSHVLHLPRNQIVVDVPRMGGGFGGKETQAAGFAAIAGLAALKTRRAVKVWLNRDQDMLWTGKRHPFVTRYTAGFSREGDLLALDAQLFSDGGWANDLSRAILDRALFHTDNTYFLPNVRVTGRVAKTHLPSNTAFRGFGGPQGMAVIEEVMSRAAEALKLEPAALRARNFYGDAPRNVTQYHQVLEHNRMPVLWPTLLASSDYARRRADVEAFNAKSVHHKRGLAVTPVKFGISFTTSFLNQAGALVVIYADGSVQVNHGGTEMGQGLHTKMLAIAAHELGITVERVRLMTTSTDKVPNTSATAASSGADLNGMAVLNACQVLRERLGSVAAKLLGVDAAQVTFRGDAAHGGGKSVPFEKVTGQAYLDQVSLSATGFYRTPGIHYDRATGRGKPFHYFAYGAAVSEVELSGLTGEHRVLRVDVLHDVGKSLLPTIDRGQVEGAFIQGMGWLTGEELQFDARGYLRTHSPDTYKIPSCGDAPAQFHVQLLENATQEGTVHGSKAVGEPPLMLALSVVAALRHAVSAFGPGEVQLAIPCTPEALLRAVGGVKAGQMV
jgi:xanthine dehydrogenase large subunit